MERVVGYFEGWAKNRPCEVFWPEQIPIGLYTHINFAFGTINPNTFSIEANDREDTDMYERLMLLKKKDKNLKIYLAIGGWTFNDPGPTAKIFSNLAASPARQKSFFNSVMSFMATHKFDGLDLDWEYPVAEDGSGREIDYKTFPIFMAALKKIMGSGNKGLTITLPASYWYLQYFDIQKLEPTVDFFNIMSYDLHGAWDQNVTWTQPYLNAHTNLTEIDLALDLLWRNNIKPEKVVMGLGFYGRAFTAQSAACRKPGCLFSEPANAGRCSRENGILLNSEIDNEIKNRNLKPELYKEEAVKTVTWGKQWVSFDDEDTLKMKVDRAGERCLGGVMVWAISHDTRDAKYNKALAKVLGRKVTSGSLDDDEKAADFVKKPYEQCRWTNCKEPCPKG
ncbi:Chitinase-3-like protein 1 [Fusarium oxysporum f. sp. cubense]|uniref:chitinase n=1 Tax=Fusarium oxysporum f. sp. cubense TaxID=61366 RepID=A0A559L6B4_FUSOC|nr:Chitinase-3-like protein 1 [Fusarium oxysporum f. sp. cubense]